MATNEEEKKIAKQELIDSQQKAAEALNNFVQELTRQGYTIDLQFAPLLFFKMYFNMGKNEFTPNRLGIIKCS